MAAAAMLLAYASAREKHMKAAVAYGVCALMAAVTIVLSLSRSGLLALAGVVTLLTAAIIAGTAKRPGRMLALLAAFVLVVGAAGAYITMDKIYEAYEEDYALAVCNHET